LLLPAAEAGIAACCWALLQLPLGNCCCLLLAVLLRLALKLLLLLGLSLPTRSACSLPLCPLTSTPDSRMLRARSVRAMVLETFKVATSGLSV
jgi:hypothetical protein